MDRNFSERDITIDFNSDKVKSAVDNIIKNGYLPRDMNPTFGTYTFAKSHGLLASIISISVSQIDETKSAIKINCKNASGSNQSDALLERRINDFLSLLADALSGKEITSTKVSEKAGGCLVILIFGVGTLITYLLSV